MILWCIRHAPVSLPPGTCYGATDLPADADLTRAAAQRWASQLPDGARLRVSALGRARQLARAVLDLRPDLAEATVDARLNEMDFGRWEQATWDAVGHEAVDDWLADFAHFPAGGGESTQAVIDRVAAVIDEERALGGHPVWVTHAGVIRSARYIADGGARPIRSAQDWPRTAPEPGGATRIRL